MRTASALCLLLTLLAAANCGESRAEAPPEPRVVTGKVVDAEGAPVSGARLWLQLRLGADEDSWGVRGETQDDGSFKLVVEPELTKVVAFYPDHTLWCYMPGYLIESVSAYRQIDQGEESPLEITLKPESDTSFKVLSPDGDPVQGALLTSFHYLAADAYRPPPQDLLATLDATSDQQGTIPIPFCDRAKLLSVRIAKEGYGEQNMGLNHGATKSQWTFPLRKTGGIRVAVAWKPGEPKKHVPVSAYSRSEQHVSGIGEAVADAKPFSLWQSDHRERRTRRERPSCADRAASTR